MEHLTEHLADARRRTRHGPVVVAVDGTDDGARALRWAAGEARRTGRRLRLVHVAHETIPMVPMLPALAAETLHDLAARVLRDARRHAEELTDGEVDVEAVLGTGPRVPALLGQAVDGSVVVLGPRSSAAKRFLTGSTTTGIAARAACPVVCVPAEWDPDQRHGRVVAGVDESTAAGQVIDAGFAAAAARDAELTLLHAWQPAVGYDRVIVGRVLLDQWREEADRVLAELAAGAAADHPDVPVHRVLEYAPAPVALVDASQRADLVVVGRTGAGAPFGLSLGTVARSLIRSAHCPVAVVPVHRSPG